MLIFNVLSRKIWIFALALLCSSNSLCHQVRPTSLNPDEKHDIAIQDGMAVYEFHISKVDVTERSSRSSYYWCVETGINDFDEEDPSSTEIIFSNGKDVRSIILPISWYDERDNRMLLIVKRMSIFCHNGRQTVNDSLRILVYSRPPSIIKSVNLSLKVSTCTANSQSWAETFMEGKLRFTTSDNISLTHPSVIKEFLPGNLQKFGEKSFILVEIQAPGSRRCLIATIQNPGCELLSLEQRDRMKQTMNTRAAFVINPSHFPFGFVLFVILDMSGDECCENLIGVTYEACEGMTTNLEATVLEISITTDSHQEDYLYGVFVVLAFDILVIAVSLVVSLHAFNFKKEFKKSFESKALENAEIPPNSEAIQEDKIMSGNDFKKHGIEIREEYAHRLKTNVTIADLCDDVDEEENQDYMYIIIILSVFYAVPTFQVVIWDSMWYSKSGDQDSCYYNFLCLKPLHSITAFNHLFSNISYVLYSFLFMYLVRLKKRRWQQFVQNVQDNFDCVTFGASSDYSLFLGLGMAFLMEGIMSASYHVCPTNIYFQFDTTYMYLIGILMLAKLYQNRHPHTNFGGSKTAILLGSLLFFETLSFYDNRSSFWIVFCVCYIAVVILNIPQIYSLNTLKHNKNIIRSFFKLLVFEIKCSCNSNQQIRRRITSIKIRILFTFMFFAYNISHAIYILSTLFTGPPHYASTHLLHIIMSNLAIYMVFYLIMKMVYKEFLVRSCKLYLVASLLLMSVSLYFFFNSPKNQDRSPASSREHNEECILFNFYDSHDLWHFLSAGGLFTLFMSLLSIDDDLVFKDRRKIPIF